MVLYIRNKSNSNFIITQCIVRSRWLQISPFVVQRLVMLLIRRGSGLDRRLIIKVKQINFILWWWSIFCMARLIFGIINLWFRRTSFSIFAWMTSFFIIPIVIEIVIAWSSTFWFRLFARIIIIPYTLMKQTVRHSIKKKKKKKKSKLYLKQEIMKFYEE